MDEQDNARGKSAVPEVKKSPTEEVRNNFDFLIKRTKLLAGDLGVIQQKQKRNPGEGISLSTSSSFTEDDKRRFLEENQNFFVDWESRSKIIATGAAEILKGSEETVFEAQHDLAVFLSKYRVGLELAETDPEFSQYLDPVILASIERILKSFEGEVLGKGSPAEFNLTQLIKEARLAFPGVGRKREFVLRGVEEQVVAKGWEEDMFRVFFNFIRNSEKVLGQEKTEPQIIHIEMEKEGDGVTIKFSDNGPGINARAVGQSAIERKVITQEELVRMSEGEIIQLIFRPGVSGFAQEGTGGSGLGLKICKRVVEEHGGKITAGNRPKPETGAEFTIKFSARDGKLGVE